VLSAKAFDSRLSPENTDAHRHEENQPSRRAFRDPNESPCVRMRKQDRRTRTPNP